MRKSARFTKILAIIIAVIMFRTSVAGAVSLVPGTLAVLEPPMAVPEMRAAWDGIRNEIYFDPLLLVRPREDVLGKLEDWRRAAESIRSAYTTAERFTLDRVQKLIEESWASYYGFEYEEAAEALNKARELLTIPGSSGFRTNLMFEVLVLGGIVARAAGDGDYTGPFKQAVAVDPDRVLSSEKYSPQIINIYNLVRDKILSGEQTALFIDGVPSDATVVIGGKEPGKVIPDKGFPVLPGAHFVEVSAPGYEPWGQTININRFEPAHVQFELIPTGPEGDPDSFFLTRLRAGDRQYMTLLTGKLDVDYLLIPDPDESTLKVWIIDRKGRTLDHVVLWKAGETMESGIRRISSVLEPFRQEWNQSISTTGAPLSLPELFQDPPRDVDSIEDSASWSGYAVAIGILLLVGAAAASERGVSTRIEATW